MITIRGPRVRQTASVPEQRGVACASPGKFQIVAINKNNAPMKSVAGLWKARFATGLAFLTLCALTGAAMVGCADTSPEAAPSEAGALDNVTIFGETLPNDALPYSQQIYRLPCSNTSTQITFDFAVSAYQPICSSDLFSDALITLDKDFHVRPLAADSWEPTADGLTWYIKIGQGQQWSDGVPLTAHDYVAAYQLSANPETGWDFAWLYGFLGPGGIKNWNRVIAGELSPEKLGVVAVDDYTLAITTEDLFPPLPGVLKYSWPLAAHALAEHGPYYNNKPETSVSSGPFMLEAYDPGNELVLVANPMYRGRRPPRLARIEHVYLAPGTEFPAYQAGAIDNIRYDFLSAADFELIFADLVMSANYLLSFGDFRTDYLLWDTFNPPFDSLDVRKAFAKAINRASIANNVFGANRAIPAHSMLMPGFPSSDTDGLLDHYQAYDCPAAREHLAQAGYPDGTGFPKQEMWLRNEPPSMTAVYQAVAASISECLNVEIEVSNKDGKVYMDALNAKPTDLAFGAVSYGMDFLDASNLLGIWVSTGRHSWLNPEFDRLVGEASSLVGDPERRDRMFRDAQEILVDDVGGAFIAHRLQGNLIQPWIQGDTIRVPDSYGISGFHFGDDTVISNIYISTAKQQ